MGTGAAGLAACPERDRLGQPGDSMGRRVIRTHDGNSDAALGVCKSSEYAAYVETDWNLYQYKRDDHSGTSDSIFYVLFLCAPHSQSRLYLIDPKLRLMYPDGLDLIPKQRDHDACESQHNPKDATEDLQAGIYLDYHPLHLVQFHLELANRINQPVDRPLVLAVEIIVYFPYLWFHGAYDTN